MFAAIGDLLDDVIVHVDDPVNVASDTNAVIDRRRGGSAANSVVAAAGLGVPARLFAQVGDDAAGRSLVADLRASGADTSFVAVGGRTGTIVVLVDPTGERTMLTDRGACDALTGASREWLTGVDTLHVPLYSLDGGPLAATTERLIAWAHELNVVVSVDLSSTALLEGWGHERVMGTLEALRPAVVFANEDEAEAVGADRSWGGAVRVVKRGAEPASVFDGRDEVAVPVEPVEVENSTGAGDAFAAGFVTGPWRTDAAAALRRAHRTARAAISGV